MGKITTYEIIKNYIESDKGNGCKLITNEQNFNEEKIKQNKNSSTIKLKIKCRCGNEFFKNFSNFKNGQKQCLNCAKEQRRKSRSYKYEYIKNYINGTNGNGCTLITTKEQFEKEIKETKIIGTLIKLKIKCSCGDEFLKPFDTFKNANRKQCKKCGNKNKQALGYKKIKEEINNAMNKEYYLLENKIEFEKAKELQNKSDSLVKLHIKRRDNEEIFFINFINFIKNSKKKNAKLINRKKTIVELYKLSYSKNLIPKYKINDYIDCHSKLLHFTKEGYKIGLNLMQLESNYKSYIFSKCNPYTIYNIRLYIKINNLQITLLSDKFESACNKKLKFLCKNNHIYYTSWNNLQNHNSKCPICNVSKGEERINNYLIKNKINYKSQKTFDNLTGLGGSPLRFDFYLKDYNLLIEYQGEQHERPVDFTGKDKKSAKEQFKKQQEHDRRKRKYAKVNNIKLLEIWYNCFDDIEFILDEVLSELNKKEILI